MFLLTFSERKNWAEVQIVLTNGFRWSLCILLCIIYTFENLRSVQWRPFQPCEQTHVPFLHWPCSWHLTSQGSCSQRGPVHPGSQRHLPVSHWPWGPQSRLHSAGTKQICGRAGYSVKAGKGITVMEEGSRSRLSRCIGQSIRRSGLEMIQICPCFTFEMFSSTQDGEKCLYHTAL